MLPVQVRVDVFRSRNLSLFLAPARRPAKSDDDSARSQPNSTIGGFLVKKAFAELVALLPPSPSFCRVNSRFRDHAVLDRSVASLDPETLVLT